MFLKLLLWRWDLDERRYVGSMKRKKLPLHESKLTVPFGILRLSELEPMEYIKRYSTKIFSMRKNCSIDALMEQIKPVDADKYDFEYRDKPKVITQFFFGYYRDFDGKNTLNDFLIHSCSPCVDFLIETLMKEIELVVTEKKMSLKIKIFQY